MTMLLKVLKVDHGGKQEVNKPRIFLPSQKLVDRGVGGGGGGGGRKHMVLRGSIFHNFITSKIPFNL